MLIASFKRSAISTNYGGFRPNLPARAGSKKRNAGRPWPGENRSRRHLSLATRDHDLLLISTTITDY
jgi:hypothetical protein